MKILTWNDLEEEQINENITRKMFWGDNVMVVQWELAPDSELPVHDHVAEQIVMVHRGSVTLIFGEGDEHELGEGAMLVIPPSVPHGVRVGPDGCTVTDLFSPVREDFIEGRESYLARSEPDPGEHASSEATETGGLTQEEKYARLHGFLRSGGINATLDQVKEYPVEILARFAYDRKCVSMGKLREILGLDKQEAKALVREWKHGDDHSEYSLQRMMERMVILPSDRKHSS